MPKKKAVPKKRGPKSQSLKIEGDWQVAVANALAKGKPPKRKK
jgi:hypothetical protein